MEIGKSCMKVKKLESTCFHWTRTYFGEDPRLLNNHQIKNKIKSMESIDKYQDIYNHCNELQQINQMNQMSCGNPYNYMTEEERLNIISEKNNMTKNEFPGHDCNSVKVILNNNKDFSFITEYISDMVSADCWTVYQKNSETNEPTKTFFDSRLNENIKGDEMRNDIIKDSSLVLPLNENTTL